MSDKITDAENKHFMDVALKKITECGSRRQAAEDAGLGYQFFLEVMRGEKKMSDKFYNYLGYERKITRKIVKLGSDVEY